MYYRYSKNKGYLIMDALVSIGVLIIVFGVFTRLVTVSHWTESRFYAQQKCTAAALAQLDSITNNKVLIPDDKIEQLWEGVRVDVSVSRGQGDFSGLNCYMVTALYGYEDDQLTSQQKRYLPFNCLVAETE